MRIALMAVLASLPVTAQDSPGSPGTKDGSRTVRPAQERVETVVMQGEGGTLLDLVDGAEGSYPYTRPNSSGGSTLLDLVDGVGVPTKQGFKSR
jgi:adenylosuccinate synthase